MDDKRKELVWAELIRALMEVPDATRQFIYGYAAGVASAAQKSA